MRKKRILLIDDERDLSLLLKLNLERTGVYEVMAQNQPTQALDSAKRFKPDLILLDIVMPGVSGFEVAAQVRAHEELKRIPIVFLTASLREQNKELDESPFHNYPIILKPATPEQIIACIEQQLI